MNITVTRDRYTDKSTIGMVDINGVLFGYLLEPPRGDGSGKAPFCVLAGIYQARKSWSDHFQKVVIRVLDVPLRTDIEWHIGNTAEDTIGCGLIGYHRNENVVLGSELALDDLLKLLPHEFSITYVDTLPEAT